MDQEYCCRILLVTFPGQGHINPSLQFAKHLLKMGAKVTLATAFSALNRMTKTSPTPAGLTFSGFSDGYDNGVKEGFDDLDRFMAELKRRGSKAVSELITSSAEKSQPFHNVVYTTLLPWVGEVARDLHVPSTFLWLQPASILDIYYYYFHGYGDSIRSNGNDPSWSINMPGLPPLTSADLPSFVLSSNSYNFALPLIKEHLDLADDSESRILVNSFDELEPEALKAVEKLNLVGVGPLTKDPTDKSVEGDLFRKSEDYVEWLDSKPNGSVVYVSFGSISVLSKQQTEEIGNGLRESKRPFLWVIRGMENEKPCLGEELESQGMVVPWCSQVEVLSHPAVGCFVTHCGWNSTLESLVFGVPVVTFPQWSDQSTNAKLIEDVWRSGVRVRRNEDGIVEGGEIKRCVEMVMESGGRGEEMRRNAVKWKDLAREAAKEGGSSNVNLKTFIDEVRAAAFSEKKNNLR